MSAYNFSGPAEILRAEQKDEELCERINRQFTDILLKYKGCYNYVQILFNVFLFK